MKSDVQVTITDIIGRCYRNGHQFRPLLTIPNQYDDDLFMSQLEGRINRKMVDIVRVANEKHTRCEEYKAIDMTVLNSLAVWHSYLGLHARWVLGVRHDKERGARKRKCCSQDGCGNLVQQGGAWGDISETQTQILQPRRVRQSSPTRRSLSQAWGEETQILQPRRVRKSTLTRRSLCQAWCEETQILQPRHVE